MRKKVLLIMSALLAIWAVSTVILGAPDDRERRNMSGEITVIDAKAMTMTIQCDVAGGPAEMRFDLDPGVIVRGAHGLRGRVEQLKFGDYVTVRYVERENRNVALEIQKS